MRCFFRKLIKNTIFFILLLLCAQNAGAQTNLVLRSGRDLSSNLVNHILCDKSGVMWISTDYGVNRLDAAKNRTYLNTEGGANSFNYGFEDSKHRLWFCGTDNVYLLDKSLGTLSPVPTFTSSGDRLSVRSSMIMERKDGTILVCSSGHGVLRLIEKDGKMQFQQYSILSGKPLEAKAASYFVSHLYEDKDGNLWVCSDKGVHVIRNGKMITVPCGEPNKYGHYSFIKYSKDGNIWCGNHVGGVWRINPKTLETVEVPGFSNIAVESIVTNHSNEVLIGTNGNGMWQINSKTLVAEQIKISIANVTDNRINIHALEDDMYDNLWIGCYQKGVVVLPKQEHRFSYLGPSNASANIIGNGCVMSFGKDATGRVWVAGDGDGLYAVSGMTSQHYAPSETMPTTVMTQYTDSRGRIWLGTWLQGLWVMEPSTGKAHKVNLPIRDGNSYSVFALTQDRMGRLWIGTLGDGLYRLNIDTGDLFVAPKVKSGIDYRAQLNIVPNNWINDFALGPKDVLFVATCDGVGAINMMTNDCLKTFKGNNRLFAGMNVNTVCYSKDNRLWVGSNSGLYCVDMKTLDIRHFTKDDGLLGNIVQSIVDTGDGTLWISNNAGVSQLHLKDNRIVNYSSHNGMFGNEFSRNAAIVMPSGVVWFGGTEGVSFFNPKNVTRPGGKTRFFVTDLYVNGQSVLLSTESGGKPIITEDIMTAKEINLDYSDNTFTLEFSTLNYMSNDALLYEYRIDDGQWQILPVGTNSVTFSNMESGSHELVIRALQQGQYSDERVIKLYVRAPWYATWWAYILYILLAVMLVIAAMNRLRQKHINDINTLKLRQQEEMNEAKTQFFTNISHEIRTPMTLVISPLQRLIATDKNAERQTAYQRMLLNAQRILLLVNQMLDVNKIDKGLMQLYFREVEMTPYIEKIVNSFCDLGETKKMEFVFESQARNLKAWIDPMNFEKVLINLLGNSFKYTPENGRVKVLLTATDRDYTIRVEDNGSGLDESQIKHIFDRFYQMKNETNRFGQMMSNGTTVIHGTGIGLNLTHSLVEMHHGTITCANNGDGQPGCHFIITLPLGRGHLKENEISTVPQGQEKPTAAPMPKPAVDVDDATTTVTKPRTRKRILIVEDDPEISRYLSEEMSRDFVVTVCENGKDALDILHKANSKIELVISDVMMPVMDGLEMLRQIRQNTSINSMPVIMLSALSTDQDSIDGLQNGADAYIPKPYNIEVVRTTAKNLIQRQSQLRNIYNGSQSPTIQSKIKVMSPDEKLMQRIMKVIIANLDNPDLGNELITREVGISRVHLYRKLKELTNLSLRDFIRNIRLTEAARLLGEQKQSIAEIAQSTGFENVSYFTVVFKQKYGVPPSQYHPENAEKDAADKQMKPEQ